MAELILKFKGKANETIHLQDKIQVKEILHDVEWDDLKTIMIVHNTFNSLVFEKTNDEGTFGLLLNGKVYEDATIYTNKNKIIDSFLMFIMEKNRYKISRPFKEVVQKKTERSRSSEYEYSNQEYDRPEHETITSDPESAMPSETRLDSKNKPRKKIKDSGISFKGFWWIIGIIYIIFRACSG